MERGLVSTQSGLRAPGLNRPEAFVFPFDAGVTCGDGVVCEVAEDEVENRCRSRLFGDDASAVRSLFGTSSGKCAVFAGLLSFAAAALSFALLLRKRVARSGLLAVPDERYIDRRFVCRSVSSTAS